MWYNIYIRRIFGETLIMKKAFTLAEVLMVLMIIGVLLGLCMGAGRVSLDKAYSLYFYRSFNGLNSAYTDFIYRGKHRKYIKMKDLYPGSTEYDDYDFAYVGEPDVHNKFASHLVDLTKNGTEGVIKYSVTKADDYFMKVDVEIPVLKSSSHPTGKITYPVLITTGYKIAGNETEHSYSMIMIQNDGQTGMLDSLAGFPTYFDDGTVGKYIPSDTEEGGYIYTPITPATYRETFCTKYTPAPEDHNPVHGTLAIGAYNTLCQDIPHGSVQKEGKVRLLKPFALRH